MLLLQNISALTKLQQKLLQLSHLSTSHLFNSSGLWNRITNLKLNKKVASDSQKVHILFSGPHLASHLSSLILNPIPSSKAWLLSLYRLEFVYFRRVGSEDLSVVRSSPD